MKIVKLDDTVGVTGQINPQDVDDIAAAGYSVIVNNRPDNEAPDQPPGEEIEAAARQAGLDYYHFPVTAQDFPGSHLEAMKALFEDEETPVLAFCRSGTRCANLWVSARDPQEQAQAAQRAAGLGYDLSMYLSRGRPRS